MPFLASSHSEQALSLAETAALAASVEGPRDDLPHKVDVLIVGAGPVGLTALNMLEALGVDCVLVERNSSTSDLPKAIAIDDEFIRLLSNLGHGEKILQTASRPFGIYFNSRTNNPLITVHAFHTPNGFGNRVAISQPVLEKVLLEGAKRTNSKISYRTAVTNLRQDESSVEVFLESEPGGIVRTIQAKYVLACDGAKSDVRKLVNIAFPGRRIDEPHLVIDLAEFPDQTPASRFFCNPRRPLNSIPGPFGGRRLEFMLNPEDDREWLLRDEGIRWIVDNFSPYSGVPLQVIRRAIYGFSERIADEFRSGNVFLLGDAAHVMPPFGGQGLNTGARDVSNICWKLQGVLRGYINPDALDSYDTERRPQVTRVVKYSVNVGRLTNLRSTLAAALRDTAVCLINLISPAREYLAHMRYLPRPAIDHGLILAGEEVSPLVGKVFPRLIVSDMEKTARPLDEWVGFRHALVLINADPEALVAVSSSAAEQLFPINVVNVVTDDAASLGKSSFRCDDKGSMAFLKMHEGQCLVVRPDLYVAACAPLASSRKMILAYAALLQSSNTRVEQLACDRNAPFNWVPPG